MAFYGRAPLRDLFDDAPTPHIAHPPHTHHRDYYIATDGSFGAVNGGLGAIIETHRGDCIQRLAQTDDSPDNNVAEYRALEVGLDALANHAAPTSRIGILVDHDNLASNLNVSALGINHPDWPVKQTQVPEASTTHWEHIQDRISGFADIRAACLRSSDNPAHVLANAPDEYSHLDTDTTISYSSSDSQDWEIPPPSRSRQHADD